jgi:hypothetical protein
MRDWKKKIEGVKAGFEGNTSDVLELQYFTHARNSLSSDVQKLSQVESPWSLTTQRD